MLAYVLLEEDTISSTIEPVAPYFKSRHKLKEVGKITRPFRFDLNKIPYDYSVEMTHRFKELDLIECPKNYGQGF